jgi:hypothetical protein
MDAELVIMGAIAVVGTMVLGYLFVKKGLKDKIVDTLYDLQTALEHAAPDASDYEPVYSKAKEFLDVGVNAIVDGKLTLTELRAIKKEGMELVGAIKPYLGFKLGFKE